MTKTVKSDSRKYSSPSSGIINNIINLFARDTGVAKNNLKVVNSPGLDVFYPFFFTPPSLNTISSPDEVERFYNKSPLDLVILSFAPRAYRITRLIGEQISLAIPHWRRRCVYVSRIFCKRERERETMSHGSSISKKMICDWTRRNNIYIFIFYAESTAPDLRQRIDMIVNDVYLFYNTIANECH